jgi:integrase
VGSIYKPKLWDRKNNKPAEESAVWWVSYYANGKRIRESSGTDDRKLAETLLKEREGRVATGQPILPRADKTRYEEARDDLLTYYTVYGKRDVAEAKGRLAHLDPYFAGYRLVAIGSAEAKAYAQTRQEAGAANGTINRELATLSKMLHLAHEDGKLMRVPIIKKLDEAPPRAGFVNREEFDAIAKHLPVELQVGALIAFTLGWRKQEVFGLQLRQLDLVESTLRLDPGQTKNGQPRVAHLTPELKSVLAAQVERVRAFQKEGRIVTLLLPHLEGRHAGTRVRDLRKTWATACKKAGRPGVLFHDLRRSAVRGLVAAGVSEKVAMTITGHQTRSVFDRYAIVNDADLKTAAAKLAVSVAR